MPIRRNTLALACGLAFVSVTQAHPLLSDTTQQWREYTRHRIAPAFSWSNIPAAEPPTVLTPYRSRPLLFSLSTDFDGRFGAFAGSPLPLHFADRNAFVIFNTPSELSLLADSRSLIGRQMIASSLEQRVGEKGHFSIGALLARQRYASPQGGLSSGGTPDRIDSGNGRVSDSSAGAGVRAGYTHEAAPGTYIDLAWQSKIDMEPFKTYRGVFSDAGDFDIPGLVEASLRYPLTPRLTVSAGVERVFYSDIPAFTSASLPTRFLALLGDGTSPVFAWRDLTVYSVESSFRDSAGGEWSLRYSTRRQPDPTSPLLRRALEPEYSDLNLVAGYRRHFGSWSALWLGASYSPTQYFLGASPYQPDRTGSQVEVEALWTLAF